MIIAQVESPAQDDIMVCVKFLKFLAKFFSSAGGAFVLGALIGLVFFALQFGLNLANPTNTAWIFYPVTHDTAQHFLGWEFFRAGSSGATITGLAYPVGLPLTFMDAIPLIALPLNLFANVLPANFQYFGVWALVCYLLLGGFAAILTRKIWLKIFTSCHSGRAIFRQKNCVDPKSSKKNREKTVASRSKNWILKQVQDDKFGDWWQILFIAAGTLIIVLNPVTLARTLYHPALAAQWLILLAILLIWDAKRFAKWWKFALIWSAVLVGAVLIHPYFLPMLGAMMLIAGLRNIDCHSGLDPESSKKNREKTVVSRSKNWILKQVQDDRFWKSVAKILAKIAWPIALAGAIFFAIGGFSLGGGAAEIYDLPDKGFNLISFLMNNHWSLLIPAIPAHSGSPETMMWLGLGLWLLVVLAAVFGWKLLQKIYQNSRKNSRAKIGFAKYFWREIIAKFRRDFSRNLAISIVTFCLLIFAIGVSLEIGPLRIFQWQPPQFIWNAWNIFRAAAREAWPFYFATILLIIFAAGKIIGAKFGAKNAPKIFAMVILIIAAIQFIDIYFSPMATSRREDFAKIQHAGSRYFTAPQIGDLLTTQKHLVELDDGFRGDQSGFYELGQTALANNLTLNIGFFSRVPDAIFAQQAAWRNKILAGQLTAADLRDNLFATRDATFAHQISRNYTVTQRGNFYFITK